MYYSRLTADDVIATKSEPVLGSVLWWFFFLSSFVDVHVLCLPGIEFPFPMRRSNHRKILTRSWRHEGRHATASHHWFDLVVDVRIVTFHILELILFPFQKKILSRRKNEFRRTDALKFTTRLCDRGTVTKPQRYTL